MTSYIKCPNCGKDTYADKEFCWVCGVNVKETKKSSKTHADEVLESRSQLVSDRDREYMRDYKESIDKEDLETELGKKPGLFSHGGKLGWLGDFLFVLLWPFIIGARICFRYETERWVWRRRRRGQDRDF